MYLYLYLKLEILQSILDVQVTGVILDVLLDIQVLQETTQPVIGKASCNTRSNVFSYLYRKLRPSVKIFGIIFAKQQIFISLIRLHFDSGVDLDS